MTVDVLNRILITPRSIAVVGDIPTCGESAIAGHIDVGERDCRNKRLPSIHRGLLLNGRSSRSHCVCTTAERANGATSP